MTEQTKTENDIQEYSNRLVPASKKTCVVFIVGLISLLLALPTPAHADIFGVFGEIFSTIQSDMGSSLKAINQMTSEIQQLYQETIWPLAQINQARGFVSNSITTYRSYMTQVFTLSSPSATLPNPQQFETILHSRTSTQIPALESSYATNYGTVPQVNQAAPQDRLMIDIDDALGQENLKTTLIADQGQDVILATANQMENQVAVSTSWTQTYRKRKHLPLVQQSVRSFEWKA